MEIKTNEAIVRFEAFGAQICSFQKTNEPLEYMWQGDPAYWAGKNPILFPIVGNTFTKDYQLNGQTYAMNNHGLVRSMEFLVKSHSDNEIIFVAHSNEDTLKRYPFNWELEVVYHLSNMKLNIDYVVTNLSDTVMPFTFGLHPAFNCPIGDGQFNDYKLVFEKIEKPIGINLRDQRVDIPAFKEISLDYQLFDQEKTMIFADLKSRYVELTNGLKGLRVGIEGYPFLAFWCGEKAPFLCIEPWYSMSDFKANSMAFNERLGMMELAPQEKFLTNYFIELI